MLLSIDRPAESQLGSFLGENMPRSRYTLDGDFAVRKAFEIARQMGNTLTPAHLLYGILFDYREEHSPVAKLLKRMNVDTNDLLARTCALMTSAKPEKQLVRANESAQQGQDALSAALKLGRNHVCAINLLQALTQLPDCATAKMLADFGITSDRLNARSVRA